MDIRIRRALVKDASGIQKLNTEILSGMVPDLFLVDENMPIDIYAAKGVLQDLWPLIDADPELSREDLMEHFFDALSVDGKLYQIADTFVKTLRSEEDYTIEEKDRRISLTEDGIAKAEKYFGIENLGEPENMEINHHLQEALKARYIMK